MPTISLEVTVLEPGRCYPVKDLPRLEYLDLLSQLDMLWPAV